MRIAPRRNRALRVFISYRREDSSAQAGRLADGLIARLGRPSVYVDVDSLAPGLDFVDQIHTSLDEATVVLAVIGPSWVSVAGQHGRRLDEENDYVRLELETALARGIPVVPVLVHGAQVPTPKELPESISKLSYRHAFPLSDNSWTRDVDALVHQLQFHYGRGRPQHHQAAGSTPRLEPAHAPTVASPPRRPWLRRWAAWRVATAFAVAAALVVGVSYAAGVGRGSSTADYQTIGSTDLVGVQRALSWSPGVVTDTLTFAAKQGGAAKDLHFTEVLPAELTSAPQAVVASPAGDVTVQLSHGLVAATIDLPSLSNAAQSVVLSIHSIVPQAKLRSVEHDLVTVMRAPGTGVLPTPKVLKVTISTPRITLHRGERAPVSALVYREGADSPDSQGVTFSVSDPSFATVENGLIVGTRVTAGKDVFLTASAGGVTSAPVPVRVLTGTAKPVPVRLSVSPSSAVIPTGQTEQLKATIVMSSGPTPKNASVSWTSSDAGVAGVTSHGLVRASEPGTAVVTARIRGLAAAADVTVLPGASGSQATTPPAAPSTAPPVDHAPKLSPIGNQHSVEGASESLALPGSDPDGDSVSYTASGLRGLGLTVTGDVISGTIPAGAVNRTSTYSKPLSESFTIRVTAHAHGKASPTRQFSWTVTDTEFIMPNYVGYAGCNDRPNCSDPPGLRSVSSYNHHFTCQPTSDQSLDSTIASQSVPPGKTWHWSDLITFVYYGDPCSS